MGPLTGPQTRSEGYYCRTFSGNNLAQHKPLKHGLFKRLIVLGPTGRLSRTVVRSPDTSPVTYFRRSSFFNSHQFTCFSKLLRNTSGSSLAWYEVKTLGCSWHWLHRINRDSSVWLYLEHCDLTLVLELGLSGLVLQLALLHPEQLELELVLPCWHCASFSASSILYFWSSSSWDETAPWSSPLEAHWKRLQPHSEPGQEVPWLDHCPTGL